MNAVRNKMDDTAIRHTVIHVLVPDGKAELLPKSSEEVLEQIRLRATIVGPVLEGILHDPHAQTHAEYEE